MVKSIRKGVVICSIVLSGCASQHVSKSIVDVPKDQLLQAEALRGASVGIAIFDEQNQKWVEKFNSDHYELVINRRTGKIVDTYKSSWTKNDEEIKQFVGECSKRDPDKDNKF